MKKRDFGLSKGLMFTVSWQPWVGPKQRQPAPPPQQLRTSFYRQRVLLQRLDGCVEKFHSNSSNNSQLSCTKYNNSLGSSDRQEPGTTTDADGVAEQLGSNLEVNFTLTYNVSFI